jgi:excisionase family DNA binding protein
MSKLALSIPEAAKLIGVSKSRMYELAKTSGFPTIQVGTRLLVSAKGLERWVEEQAQRGYVGCGS